MTRPIILIHGINCTGAVFDRMAPLLAERGYKPFAPTLFPTMRTTGPPPDAINALTLKDYVDAMADEVARVRSETGIEPALLGHSMGGLIVQALAARGIGRAGVLLTPAQPADCQKFSLAPLYTFWNVVRAGDVNRAYKIWERGFSWGVLNGVETSRHSAIYAGAVHDGGLIFRDLGRPAADPHRVATIDAAQIGVPLLTIGAKRDRATVIEAVRAVGEKYRSIGGAYLEYAAAAHWIVDEPLTPKVTSDIADWLDRVWPA